MFVRGPGTARAPTPRQEDDKRPPPAPLAQKPNREATVLGWKCKYISIFPEHVAKYDPTRHLVGQESMFFRPLPMHQPIQMLLPTWVTIASTSSVIVRTTLYLSILSAQVQFNILYTAQMRLLNKRR
ncbi:hypothetical protein T265_11200 [Opisthorchis viverrini]|uniref:Uncharacterized protein n=1 Tax=Opisthorchis viverrini TaxID=6198 RepID=A0A074YZW2_OPIVI|nr:hypothetical protein T265_11200 [Opisthorchis viverrini]KER20193.1 hypothetical protein T265_11200 [Opisthorchis viverrini]